MTPANTSNSWDGSFFNPKLLRFLSRQLSDSLAHTTPKMTSRRKARELPEAPEKPLLAVSDDATLTQPVPLSHTPSPARLVLVMACVGLVLACSGVILLLASSVASSERNARTAVPVVLLYTGRISEVEGHAFVLSIHFSILVILLPLRLNSCRSWHNPALMSCSHSFPRPNALL